jgi:hypothetical protein
MQSISLVACEHLSQVKLACSPEGSCFFVGVEEYVEVATSRNESLEDDDDERLPDHPITFAAF